jgi:hypothetical protein
LKKGSIRQLAELGFLNFSHKFTMFIFILQKKTHIFLLNLSTKKRTGKLPVLILSLSDPEFKLFNPESVLQSVQQTFIHCFVKLSVEIYITECAYAHHTCFTIPGYFCD